MPARLASPSGRVAHQTRFRSAAFGPSTRLGPLARCGPCVALRPISFPFDRQYCLPILQGAGRLATSVPIFLMLFVFPTYSFAVGAVRVRICTRTPHLWARCGPIAPVPILEGIRCGGRLWGHKRPLVLRAPILWHRPRVLDQNSTALIDRGSSTARVAGARRYHAPSTSCERALAHPAINKAIRRKLREIRRGLDPVALLSEVREAQARLGKRVDRRAGSPIIELPTQEMNVATFAVTDLCLGHAAGPPCDAGAATYVGR